MILNMANIISLDERVRQARDKEAALKKRKKIMAARKLINETRGGFRCEKCRNEIEFKEFSDMRKNPDPRVPYIFCKSCSEEYIDYIEHLKGKGDRDCYWRNEIWMETWQKWIEYRGSLDNYLRSKEFRQLLKELNQPDSE